MGDIILGVDVGGTFTDLISADLKTGEISIAKVPTSLDNQAFGVLEAVEKADVKLSDVSAISHGTTTTTNALLEQKIARVGLITTQGFRDILELGRRTRPEPYGLKGSFTPLIAREDRLEVNERMDADGEVVTPLDEEMLKEKVRILAEAGAESLVIHFLHSYKNPAHERKALEIAREIWPNEFICAGHMILSEYREYERGTTAAINGAIRPVLDRYISRLQNELTKGRFAHDLLVMQGNGGSISARIVAEAAVNTVMSGPASGVMAAAATTSAAGFKRVLTYDMGGTSTDVGLVLDGVPQVTAELDLEYGLPLHVPMVDVHTIGAGGGSIAFINDAGMLQVGPESAGASPGPICYGRGGREPTITDANLILGRLDPDKLLSVETPVSLADLRGLFEAKIGAPFGMSAEEAATAVLTIANNRMAGAMRMVSLARGHDPRDFALFAFGGAGPLHAAALARELGIPRVLIPAKPGLTNALGCVVSDLRHDFVRTLNIPLASLDIGILRETLLAQMAEGKELIARDGVETEELNFLFSADMQFQGQSHMLSVGISGPDITVEELQRRFDAAYWARFAVELPEIRAVLVNLHTAVIGKRKTLDLRLLAGKAQTDSLQDAERTRRPVMFDGKWQETPIYTRGKLPHDLLLTGPAIIEQLDTTTVIEPGDKVTADDYGNLLVEMSNGRD